MKRHASVLCLTAFIWHIGIQPLFAAGAEPLQQPAVERPIAAAIAAAGAKYVYLLSQGGSNQMTASREARIALAAAIGFSVGYGWYYFSERPLDDPGEQAGALMAGTYGAVLVGAIAYWITRP